MEGYEEDRMYKYVKGKNVEQVTQSVEEEKCQGMEGWLVCDRKEVEDRCVS